MTNDAEAKARILVVDDVEMNRDVLSRRLVRQGYDVAMAENGRVALEKLAESAFDLVLLDIMMPELDGRETLARLKADTKLSHVPVIMISANEELETIVACIELGADDYLGKPFNPQILNARVRSSLEKKRYRDRERLYAEAMAKELAIGRQIQAGFLPASLPSVPGFDVAALFTPARQCAGDFYDAFVLPGGRLFLAAGDVCDKGVGAALFMALFRSLLRAFAGESSQDEASGDLLKKVVSRTNDYIADTHGSANMFATLFAAVLEPASGNLAYVNGGQEPPMIFASGAPRERLTKTGPAAGMLPGVEFGVGIARMAPGEALVAATDGVTEAKGPNGFFGEDRLITAVAGAGASAAGIASAVESAISAHSGGGDQFDDITLLVVTRRPD